MVVFVPISGVLWISTSGVSCMHSFVLIKWRRLRR